MHYILYGLQFFLIVDEKQWEDGIFLEMNKREGKFIRQKKVASGCRVSRLSSGHQGIVR